MRLSQVYNRVVDIITKIKNCNITEIQGYSGGCSHSVDINLCFYYSNNSYNWVRSRISKDYLEAGSSIDEQLKQVAEQMYQRALRSPKFSIAEEEAGNLFMLQE